MLKWGLWKGVHPKNQKLRNRERRAVPAGGHMNGSHTYVYLDSHSRVSAACLSFLLSSPLRSSPSFFSSFPPSLLCSLLFYNPLGLERLVAGD